MTGSEKRLADLKARAADKEALLSVEIDDLKFEKGEHHKRQVKSVTLYSSCQLSTVWPTKIESNIYLVNYGSDRNSEGSACPSTFNFFNFVKKTKFGTFY